MGVYIYIVKLGGPKTGGLLLASRFPPNFPGLNMQPGVAANDVARIFSPMVRLSSCQEPPKLGGFPLVPFIYSHKKEELKRQTQVFGLLFVAGKGPHRL